MTNPSFMPRPLARAAIVPSSKPSEHAAAETNHRTADRALVEREWQIFNGELRMIGGECADARVCVVGGPIRLRAVRSRELHQISIHDHDERAGIHKSRIC